MPRPPFILPKHTLNQTAPIDRSSIKVRRRAQSRFNYHRLWTQNRLVQHDWSPENVCTKPGVRSPSIGTIATQCLH